jgi:hypothetical protein
LGLIGEHLSEVGIEGVWVSLIESKNGGSLALGGGVNLDREGNKSMVYEGDGGNIEVIDKGE